MILSLRIAVGTVRRFLKFPVDLVRLQTGSKVKLRVNDSVKPSFDVTLHEGQVIKAAVPDGAEYQGPNGLSLRSPERILNLAKNYRGHDVKVFTIPKDTAPPEGTALLNDVGHHYSLQPDEDTTVARFKEILDEFLATLPVEDRDTFVERVE